MLRPAAIVFGTLDESRSAPPTWKTHLNGVAFTDGRNYEPRQRWQSLRIQCLAAGVSSQERHFARHPGGDAASQHEDSLWSVSGGARV